MHRTLAALFLLTTALGAQDPGPRTVSVTGRVRDVAGAPIAHAEVTLGTGGPRTQTAVDGSFSFQSVTPGTYVIRARRIGFRAESRSVVVPDSGAVVDFTLVPLPNVLPAVVTAVSRGGLSGRVVDSALSPVGKAKVEVFGSGRFAHTDTAGAFYIDAKPGRYMLHVERAGYATRMISVTVPPDSGRHMIVGLTRADMGATSRQAVSMFELRWRLVRAKGPTSMRLYTREDLDRLGPREVAQIASFATVQPVDPNVCSATVNGDPGVRLPLHRVDLAEVELLEVYPGAKVGRACPQVIVWMRR